jgi:hypothetical protein
VIAQIAFGRIVRVREQGRVACDHSRNDEMRELVEYLLARTKGPKRRSFRDGKDREQHKVKLLTIPCVPCVLSPCQFWMLLVFRGISTPPLPHTCLPYLTY